MSLHSFTYLIAIILTLTCQSLSSIPIKTQQSDESFIKNSEEFIPTNEWQVVKEGQAIPPGLHVRLNLQTGLREAKFLDNNKASSNDLVPISPITEEQEQLSKKNLEHAFANLDLSKDDVITDPKHDEEIKKKYRSYDELKKDFESINMKIQTDQEILTNLLNQLKTNRNENDLTTILTDLEFYLHQYDNAIHFSDMNGLELLIQLLNSTNTNNNIRYLTSLALGAAFQGNPKVQLKGLNLSYIQYFLRLLNNEYEDNNMKIRLVFTLSTLLRNFPQGQKVFLDHGGIQVIIKIFDQINSNTKLKIRLIELMNDLIIEKDQATNDYQHVYEKIDIRNELIKHGWCLRISEYLTTINEKDFDHTEKILLAMIPLSDVCRVDFVSLLPKLDIYIKSQLNHESIDNDTKTNIENLRTNLYKTLAEDDL